MNRYVVTVTAVYPDGASSTRNYTAQAPDERMAENLAAALFGREEFEAGKVAPDRVVAEARTLV
jgi:hypothetical protein